MSSFGQAKLKWTGSSSGLLHLSPSDLLVHLTPCPFLSACIIPHPSLQTLPLLQSSVIALRIALLLKYEFLFSERPSCKNNVPYTDWVSWEEKQEEA